MKVSEKEERTSEAKTWKVQSCEHQICLPVSNGLDFKDLATVSKPIKLSKRSRGESGNVRLPPRIRRVTTECMATHGMIQSLQEHENTLWFANTAPSCEMEGKVSNRGLR